MVEPWLRETHTELDALRRQVVHALELTAEDAERWCSGFDDAAMEARPCGLPSVGFQMRHISRSLDRLMTYAEGGQLDEGQRAALGSEHDATAAAATWVELRDGLRRARERVVQCSPTAYEEVRFVGRDRVRTTLGGLLIHCAEHTQRHNGQMVTTAKVVGAGVAPLGRPLR